MIKSAVLATSALFVHAFGIFALNERIEPFIYHFYSISWWSYIFFLDAILSFKRGKFLVINKRLPYLVLISCAFWCMFELINLRLGNWFYINLPDRRSYRYLGYLIAFGTVIPGIYITAEAIHRFVGDIPIRPLSLRGHVSFLFISGFVALVLALALPRYLFPLAWVFLIPILDVINYRAGHPSIIADLEKGRAGGIIATILGGMVCGFLWESWNYWAISKWVYTVPFFEGAKLFEMPLLGYAGFAFFAFEAIGFFHFFNEGRLFRSHPLLIVSAAVICCLCAFLLMERHTVFSYLATIDKIPVISDSNRANFARKGIQSSYAVDRSVLSPYERGFLDLMELKGLGLEHTLQLYGRGIQKRDDLSRLSPAELCAIIHESQPRRCTVFVRAAGKPAPGY
ncbi:MAG TPA: hypothetical protein DCR97_07295 [Deltaproteobacteria bacterium]|nr:hypothetical protein [Deltaproteobacteria bacterium]